MQPGDQITKRRPCDEQWQTAGVNAMFRDGTTRKKADDLQEASKSLQIFIKKRVAPVLFYKFMADFHI
jgi:predicted component of type VI protein secretion system